jgi:Chalcone isomerase-like
MFQRLVCAFVIASSLAVPLRAQSVGPPQSITPEGGMPIPRAGEAMRVHLLGLIDLYGLALYVSGSTSRENLLSPEVPKVLRIQIVYEEDPRNRIGIDWRGELVPRLESAATAHLRGVFAPVRDGDVVLIEYVPGQGTTVRVNKAVAVGGVNHDLMLAFLDHWLGQRPVSEEIKHALLRSRGGG